MMPVALMLAGFFARWSAAMTRTREAIAPGIVGLTLLFWLAPSNSLKVFILVASLLATLLVFALARRRLGGALNGDCYGAAIVVTEITLLLGYPVLASLR
jgi:cobalamin synthase